jgi:hypothetical protein
VCSVAPKLEFLLTTKHTVGFAPARAAISVVLREPGSIGQLWSKVFSSMFKTTALSSKFVSAGNADHFWSQALLQAIWEGELLTWIKQAHTHIITRIHMSRQTSRHTCGTGNLGSTDEESDGGLSTWVKTGREEKVLRKGGVHWGLSREVYVSRLTAEGRT